MSDAAQPTERTAADLLADLSTNPDVTGALVVTITGRVALAISWANMPLHLLPLASLLVDDAVRKAVLAQVPPAA